MVKVKVTYTTEDSEQLAARLEALSEETSDVVLQGRAFDDVETGPDFISWVFDMNPREANVLKALVEFIQPNLNMSGPRSEINIEVKAIHPCEDPTPCTHREHYGNTEKQCEGCARHEDPIHGSGSWDYGDHWEPEDSDEPE